MSVKFNTALDGRIDRIPQLWKEIAEYADARHLVSRTRSRIQDLEQEYSDQKAKIQPALDKIRESLKALDIEPGSGNYAVAARFLDFLVISAENKRQELAIETSKARLDGAGVPALPDSLRAL